nr:hypothetical protein [Candidatus Sigynarchaeum springense]
MDFYKGRIETGNSYIWSGHTRPYKYVDWLSDYDDDKNRKTINELKAGLAKAEPILKKFKEYNEQARRDLQKFPNITESSYECLRCRSAHPSDRKIVLEKMYAINYEHHNWSHTGKQLSVWQCVRCNLYYYTTKTTGDRCLV